MNQVIENILSRRSIRSFSDEIIKKEDLEAIVQAGVHAPSAMNRQSWKFTVIQNKEVIVSLAKLVASEIGKTFEEYHFYGATTLILVSNDKDNSNGIADTGAAMENIFLAANSLGIGSVWINQLKGICDSAAIRETLNKLEVPENHIVFGIAALGYADMKPDPRALAEGVVTYIF